MDLKLLLNVDFDVLAIMVLFPALKDISNDQIGGHPGLRIGKCGGLHFKWFSALAFLGWWEISAGKVCLCVHCSITCATLIWGLVLNTV